VHPETGRPIIYNDDGSMSTEETVTVQLDGKWVNLPTIVDGKRPPEGVNDEEWAIKQYREGRNQPVGTFDSLDEAVEAAKQRSNSLGEGPPMRLGCPDSSATGPSLTSSQRSRLRGVRAPVVTRFERLQQLVGKELPVNSGYRDPNHNRRVGGAKKSQHVHGNAIDINVRSLSRQQRIDLIEKASALGFTGIGVYNNAIHVDLGGRRAWGPSYGRASVPSWARTAINRHLQNTYSGMNQFAGSSISQPVPRSQLISMIKGFEGFKAKAYDDYGQISVGYGTRARSSSETISKAEAEKRLDAEVAKAERLVDRFSKDLPPGVRLALTSLTYNAGSKWMQSGLGKAIKAGDYARARELFLQYNKANGKVLPGLVKRRQQEVAALWDGNGGGGGNFASAPPELMALGGPVGVMGSAGPPLPIANNIPPLPGFSAVSPPLPTQGPEGSPPLPVQGVDREPALPVQAPVAQPPLPQQMVISDYDRGPGGVMGMQSGPDGMPPLPVQAPQAQEDLSKPLDMGVLSQTLQMAPPSLQTSMARILLSKYPQIMRDHLRALRQQKSLAREEEMDSARKEREIQAQTKLEGYKLLFEKKLTLDWIEQNEQNLAPTTYIDLRKAITPMGRETNFQVFSDLLEKAADRPFEVADEAFAAYARGELTYQDYASLSAKIRNSITGEKPKPPEWVSSQKNVLRQNLRPSPKKMPDPEEWMIWTNALTQFENYVDREGDKLTPEKTFQFTKRLIEDTRDRFAHKKRMELPLPNSLSDVPREGITLEQAEASMAQVVESYRNGELTPAQFAEEAKRYKAWVEFLQEDQLRRGESLKRQQGQGVGGFAQPMLSTKPPAQKKEEQPKGPSGNTGAKGPAEQEQSAFDPIGFLQQWNGADPRLMARAALDQFQNISQDPRLEKAEVEMVMDVVGVGPTRIRIPASEALQMVNDRLRGIGQLAGGLS
jgi:lysozyme